MRTCSVLPAGSWSREHEIDQMRATYEDRHRRRVLLSTVSGANLLLDLPRATHLRDGDGLSVDGTPGVVRVLAAPECLLAVTGDNARHLLHLAWHVGNRHLSAVIEETRLLIREDHVVAGILVSLGATVRKVTEAFDPATSSYADAIDSEEAVPPDPSHWHGHADS